MCIYFYCSRHIKRVHHSLSKLLSTGAAKHATFVMINSPNRRQLTFSRLTAPLTETATRHKIDRDRSAKLIELHKISSDTDSSMVLIHAAMLHESEDGIEGTCVSGG